jgi:hypothetical protein
MNINTPRVCGKFLDQFQLSIKPRDFKSALAWALCWLRNIILGKQQGNRMNACKAVDGQVIVIVQLWWMTIA